MRHRKRRVPQLSFTKSQNIGWHVNYRDPDTGSPRRHRFGMIDAAEATKLHATWVAAHLNGSPTVVASKPKRRASLESASAIAITAQSGSLVHVASNYLRYEERRARKPDEPRRSGTISPTVVAERKHDVKQFLAFINRRHGSGAAGRLSVIDLTMQDIEAYNTALVDAESSDALVIETLRTNACASRFKLSISVGDEVQLSSALWFESKAGTSGMSGEAQSEVDRLSRQLIGTRRASSSEFPNLVKRIVEKLVHIARHDDVDEFEQALNIVTELIRQRIRHPISGSAAGEQSPISGLPDYLTDIQWFYIGEAVAQSGDPARIKVLLAAAKEVMFEAAEHRRPATIRVFGQVIESVYAQIARTGSAAVAEELGRRIDGDLEAVLVVGSAWPLAAWNEPVTSDRIRQVLPVYAVWTGWVLGLVRAAVAANRLEDAANFADRLRRVRVEVEQRREAGVVPGLAQVVDLLTLAEVYIVGWCVREVDRDEPSAAARGLLTRLIDADSESRLPTRERLLRAWEQFPSADDGGGLLHASTWDRDEAMRTGIAYTSSGPEWPTRGLYAALLVAESEPPYSAERVMTLIPGSRPPDDESVRSHLTAVVSRPELRATLLAEDEDASEAVAILFSRRRHAYRLDQLRRAVDAPIAEAVIERLRTETEVAALQNPSIVTAIMSLGVRATADECSEMPTINLDGDYPKGLFVEQTATSYLRFGEAIGIGLAQNWQSRFLYEIEQRATSAEAVRSEAELPYKLETGVARLRVEGFEPNTVIVPRQERFIRTLIAGPPWRRDRRRDWGPDYIGEWKGLSIFRCPYANTAAVVVFDTRALLGPAPRAGARLVIVDNHASQHADLLRAGEAADSEIGVPKNDAVRLQTRASLQPRE